MPNYAQQPGSHAQPHIRIAPPQMSANAQKVIAQAMAMPSQNWGSALSKLANVWAANRAGERETEAKAQEASEQQKRRQGWGAQLGAGMTQRDLAALDPQFVDDAKYQAFLKNTAPAPDPETFETVQDPFGRGGAAQQSSLTGKFANYQGPLATPTAPARRTAKDHRGRLRYLDTGEATFSDDLLGPNPEPEVEPISFDTQSKARREWKSESGVFNTTQDAFRRVVSSADRATAAGDLAMVFNFMKTLDPGSVVRESEFATAQNSAGIPDRLRAQYNRLLRGERLAPDQRKDFLTTAGGLYLGQVEQQERKRGQFEQAYRASGLDPANALIDYIDRDLVKRFAPQDAPQATPQGGGIATTSPQAPIIDSTQAMVAPTGQGGVAIQPDIARVGMYSQLPADALKRQAKTMQAEPGKYNDQERAAMSAAWFQKFGE